MNNDGKLTRDGFAVAMHLINGKLAGKEVPATLPPSLIPPSQRKGAPAAQPQSQIQRDLWDLEDDAPLTAPSVPTPSKAPAPAQSSAFSSAPLSPAYTGASNATATAQLPFNAASRALSPTNTGSPAPTSNEGECPYIFQHEISKIIPSYIIIAISHPTSRHARSLR